MFHNLTGHQLVFYKEDSFINLDKDTPNLWLADGVNDDPILVLESLGNIRIKRSETYENVKVEGVNLPLLDSKGELLIDSPFSLELSDKIIVSAITKSFAKELGHVLAVCMYTPYKVVRLRDSEGNPSTTVLGCVGLVY